MNVPLGPRAPVLLLAPKVPTATPNKFIGFRLRGLGFKGSWSLKGYQSFHLIYGKLFGPLGESAGWSNYNRLSYQGCLKTKALVGVLPSRARRSNPTSDTLTQNRVLALQIAA